MRCGQQVNGSSNLGLLPLFGNTVVVNKILEWTVLMRKIAVVVDIFFLFYIDWIYLRLRSNVDFSASYNGYKSYDVFSITITVTVSPASWIPPVHIMILGTVYYYCYIYCFCSLCRYHTIVIILLGSYCMLLFAQTSLILLVENGYVYFIFSKEGWLFTVRGNNEILNLQSTFFIVKKKHHRTYNLYQFRT